MWLEMCRNYLTIAEQKRLEFTVGPRKAQKGLYRKMYCPNCGKEIPDNSQGCLQCGGNLRPKQTVRVLAGVSAAAGLTGLRFAVLFAT